MDKTPRPDPTSCRTSGACSLARRAIDIAALRSCRIGRDGYLRRDRRRFTAEDLRAAVNTRTMAEGCVPSHTICALGDQAVDPH